MVNIILKRKPNIFYSRAERARVEETLNEQIRQLQLLAASNSTTAADLAAFTGE